MRKTNTIQTTILALTISCISFICHASSHTVISTENIDWGRLNPLRGDASPKAADLWGDRTKDMATGMLVKFNKGFSSPPHIHNITYRGIVIEGLMHNDDPTAEKMWLTPGSFWTQPAGESHITAADGQENLIYLEIDSGPYLVLPAKKAFDNGERPINIDERNLVWLDAKDIKWANKSKAQIAYLWGKPHSANGSFVKLPAGFKGIIKSNKSAGENSNHVKAVVVKGKGSYQWNNKKTKTALSPSSFFSSNTKGQHNITAETDMVLYINSNGAYSVK